jgi:FtsP/CotA-like multicopper oxidase with cupredoxin domain
MRRWVKWLIAGVTVTVLMMMGFGGFIAWSFMSAKVDTIGEVDFERPLAIPPLAESDVDADGRRVFDLTMQRGETDLGRDEPTETWGVNGSYLGPTLRASRGEEVVVNVDNELGEESTLHWHGMHLPAEMDGGPHQMVGDGETWSPTWEIDQPAATLWYHPHPHDETAEHVYRGVAGMFILDDPDADVDLPSTYGVDDVPVIVQDKEFDGSQLDTSHGLFESTGLLGDTVLVNGTPGPYLDVTTERVRLRVLNASNARIYNFYFPDKREYAVVGSDGGLLPKPVPMTHLELSPGERAEIVVTMEPGETVALRSAPLESSNNRFAGADDRLDILELRAAETLKPSPEVPAELAPAPDLDPGEVSEIRDFRLSGTNINGDDMDMDRIDQTVELGATERWRVSNAGGQPHNFHIHDVQFMVETLDGEAPPPELAGWKDTIFMPEGREVELLLRFTDYADPDTPYMYHCHLLLHEDSGMMGQFVVVEPGEDAGRLEDAEHEHHH